MAINIPIVTEFVDTGLKSASGAFDNFRTKVGEAEGGMGKLKAGAGAAFDSIKANAGAMALGAGAAIGTFAINAINKFSDLAMSIDDFRNRTNLTLDQSSRWKGFADELGIESDSIVKIFDKLGKAAYDEIPAFDELGIAIQRTSGGAVDIEKTFLLAIDALNDVEDPAKRARIQADLFGKGWHDAAEIIGMSSSQIEQHLKAVSDYEIIDEEEIEKAKDLRAAQDALGDALDRITITLGQQLIPALTNATDAVVPLINVLSPLVEVIGDGATANDDYATQISKSNVQMRTGIGLAEKLFRWFGLGNDETEELAETVDEKLVTAWEEGTRAMIDARIATEELTVSFEDVDYALSELKGNVDDRQAWRNLQDTVADVQDAARRAFEEGTPEALRASEAALDKARLKVAEYIAEIDTIPPDRKTDFIARLDQANLNEVERILAHLARPRSMGIIVGVGETPSEVRGVAPRMATFGLGTATPNVTVNVQGSVIAENDLVESVRKGLVNSQRNGSQLVYTNK